MKEHGNLTKRQVQALKTKAKINDVSIELFEEKGFDETTIEDISKKAGISVGAFYHYYKSKEEVFFELFKVDDYLEKEFILSPEQQNNIIEQLNMFFRVYARYVVDAGLQIAKQLFDTKNKNFVASGRYMRTLMENIVVEGQKKEQLINDLTPEFITDALFIMCRGIVFDWCLRDGEYNLEEAMVKLIERLAKTFIK